MGIYGPLGVAYSLKSFNTTIIVNEGTEQSRITAREYAIKKGVVNHCTVKDNEAQVVIQLPAEH